MDTNLAPVAVKVSPYLTVIPDRRPKQKTHANLGQAKNAIQYRMRSNVTYIDMAVYEWKNDEWSLLWEIPKGTGKDDLPWNLDKPLSVYRVERTMNFDEHTHVEARSPEEARALVAQAPEQRLWVSSANLWAQKFYRVTKSDRSRA